MFLRAACNVAKELCTSCKGYLTSGSKALKGLNQPTITKLGMAPGMAKDSIKMAFNDLDPFAQALLVDAGKLAAVSGGVGYVAGQVSS